MGGTSSKSSGRSSEREIGARPTSKARSRGQRSDTQGEQPGHAAAESTQKRKHRKPTQHSQNSKASRPWTPVPPLSPHSTDFTISTDKSADSGRFSTSRPDQRSYVRQRSSSSSCSSEFPDLPPAKINMAERNSHQYSQQGSNGYSAVGRSSSHQRLPEKDRRMIEAEKILEEIAKEYAAKRAAGLVPTKPVPARTLLWEELAKNRTQAGRRGGCIFGRDTDNVCGCSTYKKKRVPGEENTGSVCECCNHGAVWHRLVGGTMARSSRMSRSIISSGVRPSRLESMTSYVPSEARSSAYEYDSDEDEDDLDDEEIANEMAVPSNFYPVPQPSPVLQTQTSGAGDLNRLSMLSMGSSYGFPSRLSSGTNSLGALLQAIQRYRDMGLEEDEIEARIRDDFPPVPRKSSLATRSDISQISQSQVDI